MPRKRHQMPSGSLQWVHSYDETDKDTRVTGYFKKIQLSPATTAQLLHSAVMDGRVVVSDITVA